MYKIEMLLYKIEINKNLICLEFVLEELLLCNSFIIIY